MLLYWKWLRSNFWLNRYETKWFHINRTPSRCRHHWYSSCSRCSCLQWVYRGGESICPKANHNLVRNFVVTETMKCVLGESYIMEKTIDCSKAIYNDANSIRHPIINFFENKIKNPYTGGKGVAVNSGVPDNDNEIGEVHISPHSSPERLRFMICFKSPCTNANNRIDETIYLPS